MSSDNANSNAFAPTWNENRPVWVAGWRNFGELFTPLKRASFAFKGSNGRSPARRNNPMTDPLLETSRPGGTNRMARIIEVIVSPQGETTVQTKGYAGSECLKASKYLEALGVVASERKTTEYFNSAEAQQTVRQ
jgi:hypothetical protein